MKTKLLSVIIVLGLMLGFIFVANTTSTTSYARVDDPSILPIEPDTAEALLAQGRSFKYPFPNSGNNGKKFNPSGMVIPPNTPPDHVQNVITVFADFTTSPPGSPYTRPPLTYFDDMLYGTTYYPSEYTPYPDAPNDRTLENYWKEVSYGWITDIATYNMPSTLGWANTGHSYDYYCKADGIHDNGFGSFPENVQGVVLDAVKAVDAVVDFSKYAVDGKVPNLFVVYAGTGAEWSADPSIIWSHSWTLSAYNPSLPSDGYLTDDGVYVNRYAMMPEVGGDLTGYTGSVYGPYPPTCGVYAHEYGHVLGLPDQYDYGYESQGTGMYSLMASGSWARYPYDTLAKRRLFGGNSPTHLDAWSKYRLGFLTPTEVNTDVSVILRPVELYKDVYKMVVPNSGGKEYFLLENRQNVGFDISLQRYNAHGLAVYHVDDTVFSRIYSRPNEAENWKEFRSEGWRKAWTGETHYAISLIQADDQWHLEHGVNVADSADLYPGSLAIHSLSSSTLPNTSNYYFWAGSEPKFGYSGVTIENIQETSGQINADLSFVPWTPPGMR